MITEKRLRQIVRKLLEDSGRAVKSKDAERVAEIVLSRLDDSWSTSEMAVVGSNFPDLIITDGKQEVTIEVKSYHKDDKGAMTKFKAEISLPEKMLFSQDSEADQQSLPLTQRSALAQSTDMRKEDFPATKKGLLLKIKDPESPDQADRDEIIAAVERALSSTAAQKVSDKPVNVAKGSGSQTRVLHVVEGEPGDYERLRHQNPAGGGKRPMFTVSVGDVRDVGGEKIPQGEAHDIIATGVRRDFSEDDYLGLYDGKDRVRLFTLRGGDVLGLGAPLLTGEDIERWRYATMGSGVRPAVEIYVKPTSGVVVTRASGARPAAAKKPSQTPTAATSPEPEQLSLQMDSIQRFRKLVREALKSL